MFLERLHHWTDTHPEKTAVADSTRQLTYSQLTQFARIMRDVILRQSRCERIGIILPGSSAFAGTLLGCFWANRIAIPLNFLLQKPELQKVVADAGLDLILTTRHFSELAQALPVKCLFLEQLGLKAKFFWSKFFRMPPVPVVDENQTAVILYTSGTNGLPKGVELTYGNLASNCRDCVVHERIATDHTLLSVLPPFHVFGLTALTLLPLWMGMTVHYIPRFNPIEAVRTISEKRISILMAIPSMLSAMARVKSATSESFKSLYLTISGGEPLRETTAREFQERFGVTLLEGYGLTETSPVVSINQPWAQRTGTVGHPIPNCEIRIIGTNREVLGPQQDGEIVLRGPNVMKGYYRRADATASVIDSDGWFHTGDMGRIDSDGYLSITGRIKEMLIVGGENVFPREIENVLMQHPAVEEAAVIGHEDPSRGEVPIAFVILREGATADENELRALCRNNLAGFKVPREIRLRKDLPRGPTGKILKRLLKDDAKQQDQPNPTSP